MQGKLTKSLLGIGLTAVGVTLSKNYLSNVYSATGELISYFKGIKYTTIDTTSSTSEPVSLFPKTIDEIESLAKDTDKQKNLFRSAWDQPDQSAYYANVPSKVDGHIYGYISRKYLLPTSTMKWLAGLGIPTVQRMLMRSFPNGIRELPEKDADTIQADFFKSGILYDRSKVDPTYTVQGWKDGKAVQTAVCLGAVSMVAMQGLPSVEFESAVTSEKIIAAPIVVRTLSQHIFQGNVLWTPMLNTATGEVRTAFIGVGQAPFLLLDAGNNITAGPLWDTVTESSVYLMMNYPDLDKATSGFINKLDDPKVATTVWSGLPATSRLFRRILEKADKETYYAIKGNALGQYYGYVPTPTDKRAADAIIHSPDLEKPDVPFVTPEEGDKMSQK